MQTFHCNHCRHSVYFENVRCVHCGHALGFATDLRRMVAIEPVDEQRWRITGPQPAQRFYRLCRNSVEYNVCNFLVPDAEPHELCLSCRLTDTVPDLSEPENREHWYRMEVGKRRMLHTLMTLGLPIISGHDDPEQGVSFHFLAEHPGCPWVMTGHDSGVITISLSEADDAERARRRAALHEPYRTLLGHFRHEIGHYYWDRLIRDSDRLDAFRETFGDERQDYGAALDRHYLEGAPADWPQTFISAYASAHPWEDWAETWAHYLHLVDTLETASAHGVSLYPVDTVQEPDSTGLPETFDRMLANWVPLTLMLNEFNRGMGLPDSYPFVLPPSAVGKLHFVHETINATSARARAATGRFAEALSVTEAPQAVPGPRTVNG
ncbi:MAG: putative zinc-binding peptidase [Burkholderiales bacterium]|nr:putative zinc-binding peptidase [Burkholderiales bacterium]